MENLRNKNILLAGATGGIGRETAKLLVASGAKVFLTGKNKEKLNALVNELKLDEYSSYAADLTDISQLEILKNKYLAFSGSLDILINVSGIGIIKPFEKLTEEDFLNTIRINLYAPFLLMKSFLPLMREAGKGLIIHVPGVLGKVPMAGAVAYSAAKYGLRGMLQSLREELKRTEIRITQVYLGGVDTPFWDTIDLRVQRDKMIRPEEAARSIWFLCQQPSSGVVSEMVLQPFNHQAI
ncbi:MAG: SDR family oxidoreductase [Chitinophagaceae bacterium]|nr:SDR family oxidoreductase [Chitinophagaceae bacterium]